MQRSLCAQVPGLVVPSQEWGPQHEGVGDPGSFVVAPEDREAWCLQLFRSIDTTSAVGIPKQQHQAYSLGLTSGEPRLAAPW